VRDKEKSFLTSATSCQQKLSSLRQTTPSTTISRDDVGVAAKTSVGVPSAVSAGAPVGGIFV
jgi:hypothetical protein